MAVNTKIIKRRIRSVSNTKKITKAMEMVAAAKMRKAVEAALNTRTYAQMARDLLVKLSQSAKMHLPLLAVRPVKKLLVVLITSNRGLCGSFNSMIIKKTAQELADPKNISRQRIQHSHALEPSGDIACDVIGIGKKGSDFAKKMGYRLVASYSQFSDTPNLDDVLPIASLIIDAYTKKQYDKVVVAYTDYKSPILQVAKLRQVLPISEYDLEKMFLELGRGSASSEESHPADTNIQKSEHAPVEYLFEPDKENVLRTILPRLVDAGIYQAVLESAASEHSARMLAMRNASDAAGDMIDELTLTFNKARQAGITQEIAEIASGAAASSS